MLPKVLETQYIILSVHRLFKNSQYFHLMQKALQIREPLCTFNWISLIVLGTEIIAMVVAYSAHDYQQ